MVSGGALDDNCCLQHICVTRVFVFWGGGFPLAGNPLAGWFPAGRSSLKNKCWNIVFSNIKTVPFATTNYWTLCSVFFNHWFSFLFLQTAMFLQSRNEFVLKCVCFLWEGALPPAERSPWLDGWGWFPVGGNFSEQ